MEIATETQPSRPAENVVAQQRALIAKAREERLVRKEQAKTAYERELKDADLVLAKAIKVARNKKVSWVDVAAAAGMSRQVANDLMRQA